MTSKQVRALTYEHLTTMLDRGQLIVLPDKGEVYVRRTSGYVYPTSRDKDGYRRFFVSYDATLRICVVVHRAVWMVAHSGPVPAGMVLDHVDGDTDNNAAANLELVTPRENVTRALALKLWDPHFPRPTLRGARTIKIEQVPDIQRALDAGESLKEIAARYGVHRATISAIHTGYSFKYVNPEWPRRVTGGHGKGSGGFRTCKLTQDQKAVIANKLMGGARQRDLAAAYGVTSSTICLIAKAHGVAAPSHKERARRP